jgi:tetratricopeptide (TPR) repeat protein
MAHAGLADCYATSVFALNLPPKEVFPKAKEAALKALAIDETLAEAHTSLGFVNTMHDWDWKGAEREFKRAIEINPGYALAHHWYALFLAFAGGRFDEAIREITQAVELDPFSLVFNRDMGTVFSCARQYDRAIEVVKKTIELDAKFSRAHLLLGSLYLAKSMFEEAIDEFRKEKAALEIDDPVAEIVIGAVHALTGESGKAKEVAERLIEKSRREYVSSSWLAVLHFALGEDDEGFKWLDRACEERDGWLLFLNSGPLFEILGLRSVPRYQEILRRIGLDK